MSWKEKARSHWKEFRPQMYQDLLKSGQLEQALRKASDNANEEISELVSNGGLKLHEAHEIVLPRYIYLKPESEQPKLGENPPETDTLFQAESPRTNAERMTTPIIT